MTLRYVTDGLGAAVLPYGTHWTLTGPGGFLDFGSWAGAKDEIWKLSSQELGIQDYIINGDLARSFMGSDDSASVARTRHVHRPVKKEMCAKRRPVISQVVPIPGASQNSFVHGAVF